MGIKEEVQPLRKQGYNDYQIKNFLTQKGYNLNDINDELTSPVVEDKSPGKKDHKNLVIIILIIGAIALGFEINYYFFNEPEIIIPELPTFSDNPADWIEDTNTSSKFINITEATEYHSEYDNGQQRFIDLNGEILTLDHFGMYNNQVFKDNYVENKKILLKINQEMNSNDGISEAFAFFRKEGIDFNLYLLVDEDWKKESNGNLNIIWGEDLLNQDTLNTRKFDFSSNQEGIYIEKIENIEWMLTSTIKKGSVILGTITLDNLLIDNYNNSISLFFS